MRALAGTTLPGHESTYVVVVSVTPSSSEAPTLLVGNSSETPPCWSETTRIVTVTTSLFVFVFVFVLLTEAEEEEEVRGEAKTSAVPAAVILATVEVDADALVELA